jgi:replicative DNA helicase
VNDYDERTPPQDLDAERGVLGGMLMHRDAIEEVSEVLKGGEFYAPKHEQIHAAIVDLAGRGEPADAVTVADELAKRGELDRVGGPGYLHTLMESAPTAANAGYYAEIVMAKARRRGIIRAGTRLVQAGYQADDVDVDEVVENAHAELDMASPEAEFDESANGAALDELGEDLDNPVPSGVMTGFKDLDALTGGLPPGDMALSAARSAMGKSTLCLDIHRHVSMRLGQHSLMFSLEMNRKLVIKRLLSAEGRISIQHLRHGGMTERDWDAYKKLYGSIRSAPFHIVDDFGITLAQLIALSRKFARKYPLKLISVDYLQKLSTGRHKPGEREQEVGAMSSALKDLAGELNIPVIAVAQLNRGPEMRTDKTPQLSDLRESDRPVQDASLVIMPYREDYYVQESPRAGEADLFIRKNRHGPQSTITVAFQGHYSRFCDMDWTPHAAADGAR